MPLLVRGLPMYGWVFPLCRRPGFVTLDDTGLVQAEEQREHFEQLLLRVSAEVIGDDGDYLLDASTRPGEARIRFSSVTDPDRTAGVRLDSEWLEAFFFLVRNLSILKLDDYADDQYATERLRDLLKVVHAYLLGEGALESRRTILGQHRHQIRFMVDGREWLAR